jgi:hypothetical protein
LKGILNKMGRKGLGKQAYWVPASAGMTRRKTRMKREDVQG